MICIVALVVFSIMGIFSARHRPLAKEAFRCVFRKVTLRRCDTGLDTRIKTSVSGAFFKLHPKIGKFIFKQFSWISFIFTAIFIWSIIASAIGGYNYWMYGNCNGEDATGFCIFDPTGEYQGFSDVGEEGCTTPELLKASLSLETVDRSYLLDFSTGQENDLVFIGCYACEFTRKAYPDIMRLADRDDVDLFFVHFPVKNHSLELSPFVNCLYNTDKSFVRAYNDIMFETPVEELNRESVVSALNAIGAPTEAVLACADSQAAQTYAQEQFAQIEKTGIYGTPLVFINNEAVVGPKPYRVYKRMLK